MRSKIGEGSTFSLLLPAGNLLEEHERLSKRLAIESNSKESTMVKEILSSEKCQKKVLICDDEPMNVFALSAMLEEIGGVIPPITALSGEEAIRMVELEENIDLIFLDYMMPPHLDGIETIKLLKMNEAYKGEPIVMVTAATLNEEEIKFIRKETSAYIQKPIIYNVIVRTLEKLL